MTATDPKRPEHEAIYHRIRDMILFGAVVPGQPVTILGLSNSIGAGVTPVREAIRRLTAEGALQPMGNRRIMVPEITATRIDEIYFARFAIEPKMAEIAAENATDADIATLRTLDDAVNTALTLGKIEDYLESNFRFHFTLYGIAKTPILQKIAHSLWLQIGPSLRLVSARYGTSNLPDKHSDTLDALQARDGVAAMQAIDQDIRQGLELLQQEINEAAKKA